LSAQRFSAASLLLASALLACSGSNPPNPDSGSATDSGTVSVTVSPSTVTVSVGGSQSFSATVTGTSNSSVTWSVSEGVSGGSITSDGVYTAPSAAGTAHVVATSVANPSASATATVTITTSQVVSVVISPTSASVNPAGTQTFTATVSGSTNTAVTWSVEETGGGSVTQAGLYTAPSTTGSYHVIATSVADATKSAAATVSVVNGPIITVTVNPASPSVTTNANQAFTATVTNTSNTAVAWSVEESAGGSITDGGVYTAPGLVGTYHVIATSQADTTKTGTATVTVTSLPAGDTVSGTVHYSGAKTGRLYINIENCSGCGASNGTSLSSAGAYTIRGVNLGNGTYSISAFIDTLGVGVPNLAVDPAGTTTLTWSGTSASGQDITLADPTPATPTAPTNLGGSFSNDAALLVWTDTSNVDHDNVYYATTTLGTCSPLTTTYPSHQSFVSLGGNNGPNALLRGLTQGQKYCFLVTGVNNGTEGPASAAMGPVTVAAPTGASSVSGSITFTGITPSGALYVAVVQQSGGGGPTAIYFTDVASPVSPQAFTVTGVPNGTYSVFSFIDMGNAGIFGPNLVGNTNTKSPPQVTVNGGNVSSFNVTLAPGNALATVMTQLQQFSGTDQYGLQAQVGGNLKLPVAVTLQAGPNLTSLIDMGSGSGGSSVSLGTFVGLSTTVPIVGQTYEFNVTYSDGTSAVLSASVTGVISGVATLTSPAANSTGQNTTPTFTWTLPSGLPSSDTLAIQVNPNTGNNNVWQYQMASTTTSVLYDVDGSASQSPLSSATGYYWSIQINDTNGNQSQAQSTFTTQ
jgi:hypothetical protein